MSRLHFVAVLLILPIACGCGLQTKGQKPESHQVSLALSDYLEAENVDKKNLRLSDFTDVHLGNYSRELKAWPVFASYEVSYEVHGINMIVRHDSTGAPSCYAKWKKGRVVCFIPDVFVQANEQVEADLKQAFSQ